MEVLVPPSHPGTLARNPILRERQFIILCFGLGMAKPVTIDSRSTTRWAAVAFLPIGVVTVLLGPVLPILSANWSLNYAQAGSLFTVQFAASTLGSLLSGFWSSRWGYRVPIMIGLAGMMIGVLGLTAHSWTLGMSGVALYGWGVGLAIPACNLMVSDANPETRSAALNRLNFAWSAGAVLCPFLVARAIQSGRLSVFFFTLSGALFIVAAPISRSAISKSKKVEASENEKRHDGIEWWSSSVITFSLLFFLYVGIENAVGGWAASYAKVLQGSLSAVAVSSPALYYGSLTLGRLIAPFGLRRISEISMARFGLLIACLGMVGLVAARSIPVMVVALFAVGLGLSAVYPITISLLSQRFGTDAAKVGSVMFTVANFGGASLPWFVGFASVLATSLRIGLLAPLAAGVLMLGLYPKSLGEVK